GLSQERIGASVFPGGAVILGNQDSTGGGCKPRFATESHVVNLHGNERDFRFRSRGALGGCGGGLLRGHAFLAFGCCRRRSRHRSCFWSVETGFYPFLGGLVILHP